MKRYSAGGGKKSNPRRQESFQPEKTIAASALVGALLAFSSAGTCLAAAVEPTEFPTDLITDCTGVQNCREYSGTAQEITVLSMAVGLDGPRVLDFKNSFGFSAADSASGNTVVIGQTGGDLSGVVRGASRTNGDEANRNTVYINLNGRDQVLTLNGVGEKEDPSEPDTVTRDVDGSIAGASSRYGSMSENRVIVENSGLGSGSSRARSTAPILWIWKAPVRMRRSATT